MLFANSRINFFKLVGSILNNIERIIQEHNQHSSVFKKLNNVHIIYISQIH